MSGAIRVKGANVTLDNIRIVGFDTAISAEDSQIQMSNTQINRNRVGLDLKNSPSLIFNSDLTANAIDIKASNTPVHIIDSIVQNLIIDGISQVIKTKPINIQIDPFTVMAQAQAVINTRDTLSKRRKFKALI